MGRSFFAFLAAVSWLATENLLNKWCVNVILKITQTGGAVCGSRPARGRILNGGKR